MNETNNAVVILAAGSSSRMGKPKQLLPWRRSTLLQNAINQADASKFSKIIVVLGANSESIKNTLSPKVISVINKDWKNGMGTSIACGVRFLLQGEEKYTSILLMLGDQPLIDSEYLDAMLTTFQKEKGITATNYNGRAGAPALFASPYFEQLTQLNADYGAKELLRKTLSDIALMDAGAKTTDIDTEADYDSLKKTDR